MCVSGLEQIALNAVVVVGLYFLFLWVDGQTRRGAIVAFFVDVGLLGLDGGLWAV